MQLQIILQMPLSITKISMEKSSKKMDKTLYDSSRRRRKTILRIQQTFIVVVVIGVQLLTCKSYDNRLIELG